MPRRCVPEVGSCHFQNQAMSATRLFSFLALLARNKRENILYFSLGALSLVLLVEFAKLRSSTGIVRHKSSNSEKILIEAVTVIAATRGNAPPVLLITQKPALRLQDGITRYQKARNSTDVSLTNELSLPGLTSCRRTKNAITCENGKNIVLRSDFYWTPDKNLEKINSMNPGLEYSILNFVCKNEPEILFDVHTKADHDLYRHLIRNTWGAADKLATFKAAIVFNLATSPDEAVQRANEIEASIHSDIIQSSHIENYHNMTYKHVMGLQYAATYCPSAKFIIKVDDDLEVDVEDLYEDLKAFASDIPEFKSKHIFCKMIIGQANRNPASKWHTPRRIYPSR